MYLMKPSHFLNCFAKSSYFFYLVIAIDMGFLLQIISATATTRCVPVRFSRFLSHKKVRHPLFNRTIIVCLFYNVGLTIFCL